MFKHYSSIENSYRTKQIDLIQELGLDKEEFVCTTKAHGSNFSVIHQAGKLYYGKRSGLIKETENFYSYEAMLDREKKKFAALFKDLGRDGIIFGEICGGYYPHQDVEKYSEKCIQKGIYYSPKTEFYAFDLYLDDYVNYDTATELFLKHNLLHAKSLFRGNPADCLAQSNVFEEPIPSWLGYPKIENNFSEGLVIKPIENHYFGNGSRVILKNKNDKFSEIAKGPRPPKNVNSALDPESESIYDFLSAYISENRLRNVLSKIGQVTNKDFGKISGLLVQDILSDGEKDGHGITELSNVQQKFLKSRIQKECGNLIRTNFVNIIDGKF